MATGVAFCCCSPCYSWFDVLCVRRCYSAFLDCTKLMLPFYFFQPVCPFYIFVNKTATQLILRTIKQVYLIEYSMSVCCSGGQVNNTTVYKCSTQQYSILSTCPGHCVVAGHSSLQYNHSEGFGDLENSPW